MKVFIVNFRTPNGKEWCHMIAETRQQAIDQVEGAYSATEALGLTPGHPDLNLPEWML